MMVCDTLEASVMRKCGVVEPYARKLVERAQDSFDDPALVEEEAVRLYKEANNLRASQKKLRSVLKSHSNDSLTESQTETEADGKIEIPAKSPTRSGMRHKLVSAASSSRRKLVEATSISRRRLLGAASSSRNLFARRRKGMANDDEGSFSEENLFDEVAGSFEIEDPSEGQSEGAVVDLPTKYIKKQKPVEETKENIVDNWRPCYPLIAFLSDILDGRELELVQDNAAVHGRNRVKFIKEDSSPHLGAKWLSMDSPPSFLRRPIRQDSFRERAHQNSAMSLRRPTRTTSITPKERTGIIGAVQQQTKSLLGRQNSGKNLTRNESGLTVASADSNGLLRRRPSVMNQPLQRMRSFTRRKPISGGTIPLAAAESPQASLPKRPERKTSFAVDRKASSETPKRPKRQVSARKLVGV